jgi:hypothetical protein
MLRWAKAERRQAMSGRTSMGSPAAWMPLATSFRPLPVTR